MKEKGMREILGTANQIKTNEMTRHMLRDEDKAKSKDVPQMKERRIIGLIRIRQRRKAQLNPNMVLCNWTNSVLELPSLLAIDDPS